MPTIGHWNNPILNNPVVASLQNNAFRNAENAYSDTLALWNREDTAYQRMVEDMKKAGLNPWTGISSGGSQTSSDLMPHVNALGSLISTLDALDKHETSNMSLWEKASGTVQKIFNTGLGIAGKLMSSF